MGALYSTPLSSRQVALRSNLRASATAVMALADAPALAPASSVVVALTDYRPEGQPLGATELTHVRAGVCQEHHGTPVFNARWQAPPASAGFGQRPKTILGGCGRHRVELAILVWYINNLTDPHPVRQHTLKCFPSSMLGNFASCKVE